ncbi:hypothetical protein EWM64_g9578 [Hericium alpestre]|uniref:Uncharacterized protein n=1 Tax=Hericium alpestre TaxID=135208 RepID=A0A4Y9ZI90_9AGAM|nr:hypothetical protein EWM64_g9578 [Hericium alpestre]
MPLHSISSTDLLFDPPAFDTSIEAWEGQLDYVNEKVEEWKVCGARDESGLYPDLRAFLMKAIREHMVLEKQVRISPIPPSRARAHGAQVFSSVEDAYKYIRQRIPEERRQKLNVVLDSMSSGHAVRLQHLDEWERYAREQQGRGDGRELGAMYGVVERMACEITRLKVMEKNLRRMKNELQVYVEDARERGVLDDGPRGEAAPEEKGD